MSRRFRLASNVGLNKQQEVSLCWCCRRKVSQCIQLGDSIVLTVVRVNGDRVRVGIQAPAEAQVRRGELQPQMPPATGGNPANGLMARLVCNDCLIERIGYVA